MSANSKQLRSMFVFWMKDLTYNKTVKDKQYSFYFVWHLLLKMVVASEEFLGLDLEKQTL